MKHEMAARALGIIQPGYRLWPVFKLLGVIQPDETPAISDRAAGRAVAATLIAR